MLVILKNTINYFWETKLKISETIKNNCSTTSCKISKTIRQAEKVSQVRDGKNFNSSLYNETIKSEQFLEEKNNEMISYLQSLWKYL